MYAHQVIKDSLSKNGKALDRGLLYKEMTRIRNAIKFSFEIDSMPHLFKTVSNKALFFGDLGGVRLPFPCCWFDYIRRLDDNGKEFQKRGWLISEDFVQGYYIITATFFAHMHHAGNQWERRPWGYVISPDVGYSIISGVPDGNYQTGGKFLTIQQGAIVAIHLPMFEPDIDPEYTGKVIIEDREDVALLNLMLMLLSCRNIETVDNPPPEKLNKKRQKKGRQPLFT